MLEDIYNQTVTILNKLKRTDSETNLDEWHKTVLNNVAWYTDSARSAGGSSVFIGTYITVLIPFNDKYLPYLEWRELKNKEEYFTISTGDYIILGDIAETFDASNIVKAIEKYGENVCLVRHHNAAYNRFGSKVQLKIEGV